MTKEQFRQLCEKDLLFLDGATGSNLQKRGMPAGVCPERWIVEHKEILTGLQREYVEAGTQILYAPTFSANRIKLAEYGLEGELRELNRQLVEISREAAGGRALVAGDLTMTGELLAPMGSMDFEELIGVYREQISCLAEAGADLLVIETMMSLQETRAALLAARETCPDLPVMATMTFEGDGRCLFGTDAETAAVVLESLGADAVGANCSTGPAQMAEVVRRMSRVTRIPIIAKPNAGMPSLNEAGETVYHMDAEAFAEGMRAVLEAGATVVGGCCGTTPAHIRALARWRGQRLFTGKRREAGQRFLTSERMTVSFGLNDPFLVIGERINPTGKKKLQAELREGSFDLVLQLAQQQEEAGARLLDVNFGMSGIDEKQVMLEGIQEIAGVTSLPLSLDSSHVEVLEAALRRYPGRALINSISYEEEKMEQLLPIAKKYGAMFILLPLSDAGLPASQKEKMEIIEQLLERAYAVGLEKEDVIVDGLVTTVGANPRAALETLETIQNCRREGLATVCGLSNISFGLPERGQINAAFLTMAIQAGLTMAIANPGQEMLRCAAFASDLLLAKEESDVRYIEAMASDQERREAGAQAKEAAVGGKQPLPTGVSQTAGSVGQPQMEPEKTQAAKEREPETAQTAFGPEEEELAGKLREAVLKGKRKTIEQITKEALEAGMQPEQLLDQVLLPAIREVGELFDQGRYFLPQLIAGAEAMKLSVGILEPLLLKNGSREDMPVVVIATVEGDIHDIGKNLVALMLKNYGFRVVDLGKDVPRETIVEAAIAHKAQIIALSALMTTTMQEMRRVVDYARERGVTAKIMIGGAVITQEFADEIAADGYSEDAAEAVKLAQKLLGLGKPAGSVSVF